MKVYYEHAYSTSTMMLFQCRAMRGDESHFTVQILKTFGGSEDVDRATVALMDTRGEYSIVRLVSRPSSEMELYREELVPTMASDTSASWKKVARRDARGLLEQASKDVKLSTSPVSEAQARSLFRFKKTGERKEIVR